MTRWHLAVATFVATVALLEGALVLFFALVAMSEGKMKIAQPMAIYLGAALLVTMVPAFALLRAGRDAWAAVAALGSAVLFVCAWRFA